MKILHLPRYDRRAASSRIRPYQYLPYLAEKGLVIETAPLLDRDYLQRTYRGEGKHLGRILRAYLKRLGHLLRCRKYDLILMERKLFPYLPAWAEMLLARFGPPYIADYDDAVFHYYDRNRNPLIRYALGRKIDRVMKGAALVIAGNEYLAERGRRAGAVNIALLPSVVDLAQYPYSEPPRHEEFVIGWIGSPLTARYLRLVADALREVCREGKTRVVLVGAAQLDLPGLPVCFRPWSEETEAAEVAGFDVGIMPLVNEPLERGKCGYKLIQYMACGRPVVASPVGINRQLVDHGVNGFLAETTADWVEALAVLHRDRELRARMGAAGRLKVEQGYCLQIAAPRLLGLMQGAVRGVGG